MSKSIIFDKAIDYIDEHIKEDKEEIRKGLFNGQDKSKNASKRFSGVISFLTNRQLTLDTYIIKRKMYFAAHELLNNPDVNITKIASYYGYSSSKFTITFEKEYDMSPTDFRKLRPHVNDNRLSLTVPQIESNSFLSRTLDNYFKGNLDRIGTFENDYLDIFFNAVEEFGFDTDTCCIISDLSERLNIPFAYLLDKCFDMAIDAQGENYYIDSSENQKAIELGIKNPDDIKKICKYYDTDTVYELSSRKVEEYYIK